MPLCEIRSGDNPVVSLPLRGMRPDEGRRTPVKQLKKVLFPAPFGPIIARISFRWTSRRIWLRAVSPAKAGILRFQSLVPGSSQGQALGPRFRGGDDLAAGANSFTRSFAGIGIFRDSFGIGL